MDCIDSDRELQLKPPDKQNDIVIVDDAPSCWICLSEGPDELGGELRYGMVLSVWIILLAVVARMSNIL